MPFNSASDAFQLRPDIIARIGPTAQRLRGAHVQVPGADADRRRREQTSAGVRRRRRARDPSDRARREHRGEDVRAVRRKDFDDGGHAEDDAEHHSRAKRVEDRLRAELYSQDARRAARVSAEPRAVPAADADGADAVVHRRAGRGLPEGSEIGGV
eukprot:31405-Pelagococcus_subviridis.AAC.7